VEVFLCDAASDLFITRNWFNRSMYSSLNVTSVPDHHGRHAIVVDSNLFDGTANGTGFSVAQDYSFREGQTLAITNNTFLAFGRANLHYKLLEQSDVTSHTLLARNHFHTPLGGIACTRALGGVPPDSILAASAERHWRIKDNTTHVANPAPGVIQQPGGMKLWPSVLLSQDVTDPNYLRFPRDAPLWLDGTEHMTWIGALPPGPAPPEGDWFTELLDRWNAVPESNHHAPPK
jgi:hypothetical protein